MLWFSFYWYIIRCGSHHICVVLLLQVPKVHTLKSRIFFFSSFKISTFSSYVFSLVHILIWTLFLLNFLAKDLCVVSYFHFSIRELYLMTFKLK